MGHIGYTPQYKKIQIRRANRKEINLLLNEAKSIEKAGAFSLVLECLTPRAAKKLPSKFQFHL